MEELEAQLQTIASPTNRRSMRRTTTSIEDEFDSERAKKVLVRSKIISAVYKQLAHASAKRYAARSRRISLLGIVLAAISGLVTLTVTSTAYDIFAGAIAILSSVVQSVRNLYSFDILAEKFREESNELSMLGASIERSLLDGTSAEEYSMIQRTFGEILSKMPLLDDRVVRNYVADNEEFIAQASRLGILPDELANPQSFVELYLGAVRDIEQLPLSPGSYGRVNLMSTAITANAGRTVNKIFRKKNDSA